MCVIESSLFGLSHTIMTNQKLLLNDSYILLVFIILITIKLRLLVIVKITVCWPQDSGSTFLVGLLCQGSVSRTCFFSSILVSGWSELEIKSLLYTQVCLFMLLLNFSWYILFLKIHNLNVLKNKILIFKVILGSSNIIFVYLFK